MFSLLYDFTSSKNEIKYQPADVVTGSCDADFQEYFHSLGNTFSLLPRIRQEY